MLELLGDDQSGSLPELDSKVLELDGSQSSLFKTVASCMAQGMGTDEVAKFIEEPIDKVRVLFKHTLVIEELKHLSQSEGAQQALENVLAGAQLDSVFRLIHLRDSAASETVQYNSASKIIELAVKHPTKDLDDLPTDPLARAQELERRIQKLTK